MAEINMNNNLRAIIAIAVSLVVWAILGIGIGLTTLFNNSAITVSGSVIVPGTVLSIAQTLVAVGAGIGVALKFFE